MVEVSYPRKLEPMVEVSYPRKLEPRTIDDRTSTRARAREKR